MTQPSPPAPHAHQQVVRAHCSEPAWERAVRLSQVLSGLRHHGLPVLTGLHATDSAVTLTLDHDLGTPMVDHAGQVDEAAVRDWLRRLAEVLDWLHHHAPPIVHGDLQLSDLMLDGDGVRIVGWFRDVAGGTTPADDLHAVGHIAVYLLTGRPSHDLMVDGTSTYREHVRLEPELAAMLDALLHPDPAHRPTAAQLLEGLLEPGDDYADAITEPTETPAPPRDRQRRTVDLSTDLGAAVADSGTPWGLIAAVAVVVGAGSLAAWLLG